MERSQVKSRRFVWYLVREKVLCSSIWKRQPNFDSQLNLTDPAWNEYFIEKFLQRNIETYTHHDSLMLKCFRQFDYLNVL